MATWGYSGKVGEWHADLPGGKSNSDLQGRFSRLIETLDSILPALLTLHKIRRVTADYAYLTESLTDDEVFEGVDLRVTAPQHLLASLKDLAQEHTRILITALFIDLDTIVDDGNSHVIVPDSAQLYLGTNVEAVGETQPYLHVSYSTYIDVWLATTLGPDRVERENTKLAKYNAPRLRQFLAQLEQSFHTQLLPGESYYYSNAIARDGFCQVIEMSSDITQQVR